MANTVAMRTVLGSNTDDKSVHAQAIYKVIQAEASPDDRVEILTIALTERDSVPKTPKALPNKGIAQEDWDRLVKTHSDMITGHLKMAFFKTRTVKDFAAEILRLVDFFADENEKAFVLAKSLFSPYVPYHELPGTPAQMTQSEYNHKLKSDPKHVELIDYISALPFDERTERASMILQVLDDTTDKELRVALLAHANFIIEKKIERAIRKQLE